jgi:hypothetical protein
LVGLAGLAGNPARADLFNNKIILVGDKGAALGGAYAGLADDATATFYNPAGMTQLKNIKLNVSAQVVQFQKQRIQIAEDKFIPYNSFNFSPSITSFSQRVGKYAYGFSIVTPQNDLFRGEQSLEAAYRDTPEDPGPCLQDPGFTPCHTKLNLSYSDVSKVNMIGPSGAMEFDDNISLGATLYGIYYTQLERTSYGGYNANYVDGNEDDLARFYEDLIVRSVSQTGLGVTASFGIMVRMDQGFSFGVNASPGSMVWVDRVEEQRAEFLQNERLIYTDTVRTVTRADVYDRTLEGSHTELTAPRISAGVSWRPIDRLLLTAQTDWAMGSLYTYQGITSPTGNDMARSGFETFSSSPARYTVEKKSVVNFSGGLDFRFNKEYSAAIGGYTDFSQGPYEDRPASWNRRIDYFGAALSVGIEKQYTESRFGLNAAWGDAAITHFQWVSKEGGQPIVDVGESGEVRRLRKNFDSYNVGIFLSSTLKI